MQKSEQMNNYNKARGWILSLILFNIFSFIQLIYNYSEDKNKSRIDIQAKFYKDVMIHLILFFVYIYLYILVGRII